ncbi:MAG: choline dehydrogenase [Rickettsiales bacterium]|jgi:choline dehydrogenase|nr:choline dehydrogenase [Rickettsiales bacterium]
MGDALTFDYIVIGAGSAGSVLANRLSADGKHTVLVLEAGPVGHPWSRIPGGFSRLIDHPIVNWCFSTEPEDGNGQRRLFVPRGKLLGGTSAINGMIFTRGQAQDFDTWAQLGNRGWGFEDVLPIFKAMESYRGPTDENYRGRDGPLKVSESVETGEIYDRIIEAAGQIGIQKTQDYNGARQDGISMSQTTIRRGRRMSTAYCYIDPARKRPNLEIRTNVMAERLLFTGKRCTGVQYRRDGLSIDASAKREVIVCGGAFNSPQLLELSGIGNPELLAQHGVDVVSALKGVGENLREHYSPRLKWRIPAELKLTYNAKMKGLGPIRQVFRYMFTGTGILGLTSSPIRCFFRSHAGLETPDATVAWFPFLIGEKFNLSDDSGITAIAHALRAESLGSVHIASRNPAQQPAIRYNALNSQIDCDVTIAAIRTARKIMTAPALEGIVTDEIAPGLGMQDDQELLKWVCETGDAAYHPVGTCKMGNDPIAVVDDQLRVHGVERLRVADASIMPTQPSGNTNAPTIMIGEKASKMILGGA